MSDSIRAPAAWSALLADAVSKPGIIAEAYSRFWNYSVGNQILAMWQCILRGISPGPINTFIGWKELRRFVRKGEKALILCMPVTVKAKQQTGGDAGDDAGDAAPETFTKFLYRAHWFTLSQTDGEPYQPQELPGWSEALALTTLGITREDFQQADGNAQGYAKGLSVAVSPIAFQPHRTLFHELAHAVLGHTLEGEQVDLPQTPRSLREVEAESVALICCESLGLPGADYSRGYIQHWLQKDSIPEKSAQRIFRAADKVLRSGRPNGCPPVDAIPA